ncbi:hypothetical protein CC_2424 [Caulobacter vibrioides CB15]|uniref:Integrase n=2 Tax=Caulobacter vibrioides TaxID=155892 RepID=Q9A5M3_CAUVC|nr:Arm DNA-binding domain-containing protein [Caulobacter vibrioides]YP_002517879.1 transposase/integrase-related peptide [Caulobacter vibrioides NA1000]AAK24395.1 hypothetical protein CC_2424 [Caulobacter vibrioides CB15]ACL95971.1 transposase/integrase-related peptide [Caulobacter vibrioides NA1000]
MQRLNASALRRLDSPGFDPDGDGLHSQIAGTGGRSWVFRYWVRGRE